MQAKQFAVTFDVSPLTAPCSADAFDVRDEASATSFTIWYCDLETGLRTGDPVTIPAGGIITLYAPEGERFKDGRTFALIQGSGSFTAIVIPRRV
jgi:hypothetical protein